MSKLAEFRQLEKHLAEQLQALEALKGVGADGKLTYPADRNLTWAGC